MRLPPDIQQKVIDVDECCPTQRASDNYDSARFQAICVARSWFRHSGVISSRPPALITLTGALRWGATQYPEGA